MLRAKIESTLDTGAPQTFRDENGGLWRIGVDAGDGTLAVEEIYDDCDPEDAETVGMMPCGIGQWHEDGLEIERASSHGENRTEGTEYTGPFDEEYRATPSGWDKA